MASNTHKNLKSEMDSIGKDLVQEIKSEIESAGAVKTGKMKNSIDYKIDDNVNDVTIQLEAIYYYEYVDSGTKNIKPREFSKKAVKKVLSKHRNKMTDAVKSDVQSLINQIVYKK